MREVGCCRRCMLGAACLGTEHPQSRICGEAGLRWGGGRGGWGGGGGGHYAVGEGSSRAYLRRGFDILGNNNAWFMLAVS